MRCWLLMVCLLWGNAGGVRAEPGATLVPDRETVVRLGRAAKGFESLQAGRGVTVHPADPLPDGRVPVVVLVLVPADRKRHGWEQEIDLLERKIEILKAEMAGAYGEREYQLAKMIDETRKEVQAIRDRVGASGMKTDLVDFKAVDVGILILKKQKGQWKLAGTHRLGRYAKPELGAPPADASLEARVRDFNRNGFFELMLTTYIGLFLPESSGRVARSHRYHYLVEFFPQGPRTTYRIDGGIDSAGMCELPLDGMSTARLWIKSPRRGPAVLTVSRDRSMCERGQDPLGDQPAFQRLAWSDKYRRWQVFKGFEPDGFLIVAASSGDQEKIKKTLRRFRRRRIRRRFRLGKGFPRVVMSDDVRGLKAGVYLLVLGACSDRRRAGTVMRQIRKKYRGRGLSYALRGFLKKPNTRLWGTCPKAR